MKIDCVQHKLKDIQVDALFVGLTFKTEKKGKETTSTFKHHAAFASLDKLLDGMLEQACTQDNFKAQEDEMLVVHTLKKLKPTRVILVGLGNEDKLSASNIQQLGAQCIKKSMHLGAKEVAILLPQECHTESLVLGAHLGAYRFEKYKTTHKKPPLTPPQRVLIVENTAQKVDALSESLAQAICLARDCVNEPANVLYPDSFAQLAQKVTKNAQIGCRVLDQKALHKERMNLMLAVGQGSTHEPRLVHLNYIPKKKTSAAKIVFIGKGVTFDSGGLCIKPPKSMEDMKIDMAGAAVVLGIMSIVAELGLGFEVHGLLGLVENMPSGTSYRLGDVIYSRKGLSVEINNTDAEGRLVLADVIDYAKTTLKATHLIDLATLTGACMVALGPKTAGVFSNHEEMVKSLLDAAKNASEDMWRLPLNQALKEQLKSDVADMKNTGESYGGAITAALFLQAFVEDTPWVHMDIAGPTTTSSNQGIYQKGATGFGVATLIHWLQHFKD